MAILQKLKSLLGLGDSRSERPRERDVGVTVERESSRSEGATDSDRQAGPVSSPKDDRGVEDVVETEPETDVDESGTEPETDVDESETEPETDVDESETEPTVEDGVAAGTDASSSTDTMVEPTESPEEAAEPAEATGPTEADAAPEAEKAGEPVEAVPVEDIKGIGPAYSDRLVEAGVESVSDLATADAEELAEETDISEKRLQGWIDRAKVR